MAGAIINAIINIILLHTTPHIIALNEILAETKRITKPILMIAFMIAISKKINYSIKMQVCNILPFLLCSIVMKY